MSDEKRDLTLIKAWKAGDTSAAQILFKESYERVLKFVAFYIDSMTINRQDTIEEIASEAFVRAYNKIDEYNGSVTFYTWLRGFAANCLKEKIRSIKKEQTNENLENDLIFESEISEFGNPENIAILNEKNEVLREVILSLPEDYRLILSLRIIKGMRYKEISELTGKHEDNLESLFSRALKALKNKFKERYENNF